MADSKNILVVDDSSTIRKFVAFTLEMSGYKVHTAVDGMEALERLSEHPIDLAIIDLNMPIMDGFELTERIRGSNLTTNLPVVILTSEDSESSHSFAKELGVAAYISKPFDGVKIQVTIDEIFSNRKDA